MELTDLSRRFKKLRDFKDILDLYRRTDELWIQGLWGSSLSLFFISFWEECKNRLLIVTSSVERAEKVCEDLEMFHKDKVFLFPAWEMLPDQIVELKVIMQQGWGGLADRVAV